MEFTTEPLSALDALLFKTRKYEECQGRNIMVCKDCTSLNMINMTRYVFESSLSAWCFDKGSFKREEEVRSLVFCDSTNARLASLAALSHVQYILACPILITVSMFLSLKGKKLCL